MDLPAAYQRRPSKLIHIAFAPVGGIAVVTGPAGATTVRPAVPVGVGVVTRPAVRIGAGDSSTAARSYARAYVGGASACGSGVGIAPSMPMSVGSDGARLPVVPASAPVRRRSYGCMRPPISGTKTIL